MARSDGKPAFSSHGATQITKPGSMLTKIGPALLSLMIYTPKAATERPPRNRTLNCRISLLLSAEYRPPSLLDTPKAAIDYLQSTTCNPTGSISPRIYLELQRRRLETGMPETATTTSRVRCLKICPRSLLEEALSGLGICLPAESHYSQHRKPASTAAGHPG